MPKRRRFKDPLLQGAYDHLRSRSPDLEQHRASGLGGNSYVIGYTLPDQPYRFMGRRSLGYACWAAGVDNARDDQAATSVKGQADG